MKMEIPYKNCGCGLCTYRRNSPYKDKWTGKFYYPEEVKEIDSQPVTAWIVEFEDGTKQIHIWHKDAEIMEVVHSISVSNQGKKFKVTRLDCGHVNIEYKGNNQTMSLDARAVTNEGCIAEL